MAEINLTQYGITGTTEIVHNPSYELLYEEETKADLTGYEKGQESELGAVNVLSMGRSLSSRINARRMAFFVSCAMFFLQFFSFIYHQLTRANMPLSTDGMMC